MNQVRTLTVIWAAMLMTVMGFGAVAAFLISQWSRGDARQMPMVVVVLGLASLGTLAASFLVPNIVLTSGVGEPAARAFQATVLSLALAEGSGLVIGVMAIVTKDPRVLAALALQVSVLVTRRPSPEKLADLTLRAGGGN